MFCGQLHHPVRHEAQVRLPILRSRARHDTPIYAAWELLFLEMTVCNSPCIRQFFLVCEDSLVEECSFRDKYPNAL